MPKSNRSSRPVPRIRRERIDLLVATVPIACQPRNRTAGSKDLLPETSTSRSVHEWLARSNAPADQKDSFEKLTNIFQGSPGPGRPIAYPVPQVARDPRMAS